MSSGPHAFGSSIILLGRSPSCLGAAYISLHTMRWNVSLFVFGKCCCGFYLKLLAPRWSAMGIASIIFLLVERRERVSWAFLASAQSGGRNVASDSDFNVHSIPICFGYMQSHVCHLHIPLHCNNGFLLSALWTHIYSNILYFIYFSIGTAPKTCFRCR